MGDFSSGYQKLRSKGWLVTLCTLPVSGRDMLMVTGPNKGSGMAMMNGDTPDEAMRLLLKREFSGGITAPGGKALPPAPPVSAGFFDALMENWTAREENMEARRAYSPRN